MSEVYRIRESRSLMIFNAVCGGAFWVYQGWKIFRGATADMISFLVTLGFALLMSYFFYRSVRRALMETELWLEGNDLCLRLGGTMGDQFLTISRSMKILRIHRGGLNLEWAAGKLNLRTRELGTITLAMGEPAKPLAKWLEAQGLKPVLAY